jgi:hypothetical protein
MEIFIILMALPGQARSLRLWAEYQEVWEKHLMVQFSLRQTVLHGQPASPARQMSFLASHGQAPSLRQWGLAAQFSLRQTALHGQPASPARQMSFMASPGQAQSLRLWEVAAQSSLRLTV